jgi:hypothetical protein
MILLIFIHLHGVHIYTLEGGSSPEEVPVVGEASVGEPGATTVDEETGQRRFQIKWAMVCFSTGPMRLVRTNMLTIHELSC